MDTAKESCSARAIEFDEDLSVVPLAPRETKNNDVDGESGYTPSGNPYGQPGHGYNKPDINPDEPEKTFSRSAPQDIRRNIQPQYRLPRRNEPNLVTTLQRKRVNLPLPLLMPDSTFKILSCQGGYFGEKCLDLVVVKPEVYKRNTFLRLFNAEVRNDGKAYSNPPKPSKDDRQPKECGKVGILCLSYYNEWNKTMDNDGKTTIEN